MSTPERSGALERYGRAAHPSSAAAPSEPGAGWSHRWVSRFATPAVRVGLLVLAAVVVLVVMLWQAVTAGGAPDPTAPGISPAAMIVSAGVLVFREGLEAVLVLAAVTAGMVRGGEEQRAYLRAVPVGALAAFLATIVTWFAVVAIISEVNAPELHVQAATGLLAIVVLLVIMNWFFHKFYWTGWIAHHSNRKKRLIEGAQGENARRPFLGLALLGFTAIYREGFEIVLFLQNLRLRAGNGPVLEGAAIGLGLTLVVAALTFLAHQKLPYKRMLVWTGILLGVVLLVMVGESAQEMQQAGWLSTTPVHLPVPAWMSLWFAVFPNVESLAAQALAALLVVGSYFAVPYVRRAQTRRKSEVGHVSPQTTQSEIDNP